MQPYPKILNCIISQFLKIKFSFRQQLPDVLFIYLGMLILIYDIVSHFLLHPGDIYNIDSR